MRIDKYLAQAAVGTRKVVRNYVKEGKVTVNEQVFYDPATEINEDTDEVYYLGTKVVLTRMVYYMFHKPSGCVTARRDADNPTVLDYFDVGGMEGLFPVGRLDKDTEGLLLLTNDGELNHRLMYPDKKVDKTYLFWVFGELNEEKLDWLKKGVAIAPEEPLAKAVEIQVEEHGTYGELRERMLIENENSAKNKCEDQPVASGYITISEGRKHQIKRMLKGVGCYVVYLKRTAIGELKLDDSLPKGAYRELTQEELDLLQ